MPIKLAPLLRCSVQELKETGGQMTGKINAPFQTTGTEHKFFSKIVEAFIRGLA
ncbi:MAG: hypothetical protein ACE3JK_02995 [Sporolactobacillus sp.]